MPRIFKHLEAGCLQINLKSTSAQINQLKYTILGYWNSGKSTKTATKIVYRCEDINYKDNRLSLLEFSSLEERRVRGIW